MKINSCGDKEDDGAMYICFGLFEDDYFFRKLKKDRNTFTFALAWS